MPKETVSYYESNKHRRHNRKLINKTSHLADSDFIVCLLYKDMYYYYYYYYYYYACIVLYCLVHFHFIITSRFVKV